MVQSDLMKHRHREICRDTWDTENATKKTSPRSLLLMSAERLEMKKEQQITNICVFFKKMKKCICFNQIYLKHLLKIPLSGSRNEKRAQPFKGKPNLFLYSSLLQQMPLFFSSVRGRCKYSSEGHMQNNLLEGKICLEKCMPFFNDGALTEKW